MYLKTPTTVIIITTVHNSCTQLYCELAIDHTQECLKDKKVTPTKVATRTCASIYNIHWLIKG